MSGENTPRHGWGPMPLALKFLAVVMALWSLGALLNLPNLMDGGLPLFGVFVFGVAALAVVLFLDLVGPLIFFFALWNRKAWGPRWAAFYIGLFIVNSIVALVMVRAQLGSAQILGPMTASFLFLAVIFWKRDYFTQVG